MTFPFITHIDQIRHIVESKEEFSIRDKGGYIAVDYAVQMPGTFDSDLAKELRGIKFYPDGSIMSRPLHKFNNKGQNPEQERKITNDCVILEKMDGSMVHPAWDNGEFCFMTRGGRTDVSYRCERDFMHREDYIDYMIEVMNRGFTPVFEYTAPDNQIVINYDEPRLTLLAIRENDTGEYIDVRTNKLFHLPTEYSVSDLDNVYDWIGTEGVVVIWPDGQRLKYKALDYVMKHRAIDSIRHEKDALWFVLNDKTDDIAQVLSEENYAKFMRYHNDVWRSVGQHAERFNNLLKDCEGMDRKEVAFKIQSELNKTEQAIFWRIYNRHQSASDAIINAILRDPLTSTTVENRRFLIGTQYANITALE